MINIFVISADLIGIAEIIFAVMENERTVTGMAKTITGVDYEGGKVVGVTISGIIDADNDQTTSAYFQRVQHGRWLNANSRPKTYERRCTACDGKAYFCGIGCSYKYCPNCGAKMEGGGDNAAD